MLDIEKFKNLDAEYRSAPFWSWNDELHNDELCHQIHQMYEQGMGGFFMHPRGGLKDEYLGEKFMEAIKVCIAEAKKLGMKAWFLLVITGNMFSPCQLIMVVSCLIMNICRCQVSICFLTLLMTGDNLVMT